ncbi:MAG TPA: cyclophilin-like fold protein [Dermatophilaceae bacterium]|nr:cyclophilin-like fold protein [Dermatophilaceae bacterium]
MTLDDTAPARAFAAMLPLRLTMHDPMGQAKSGQLPATIAVTGADRVVDPSVGLLYYWAPGNAVAIFYDDLGQTVPPPGLVRLGVVDSGAASIGKGGNRIPVRIELADRTGTHPGSSS